MCISLHGDVAISPYHEMHPPNETASQVHLPSASGSGTSLYGKVTSKSSILLVKEGHPGEKSFFSKHINRPIPQGKNWTFSKMVKMMMMMLHFHEQTFTISLSWIYVAFGNITGISIFSRYPLSITFSFTVLSLLHS